MAGYIGSKAVNLSTTGADINGNANIDGDLSFGDNNKAIFGAGSDLQIYHDGTHSYIKDAGTGNLRILGANIAISNAAGTENHIVCYDNGAVELSYDDVTKIATTSTGIDVTGTVTADGLTVSSSGTANSLTLTKTDGNATKLVAGNTEGTHTFEFNNGGMFLSDTTGLRLGLGSGGDISFYEDTGTTAKFFWDASAESLGIGESDPDTSLDVVGGSADSVIGTLTLKNDNIGASAGTGINFVVDGVNDVTTAAIYGQRTGAAYHQGSLQFLTNDSAGGGLTERMRIDSSGNLLVGTTSPILSAANRGNITLNGTSESIINLGVGGAQGGYLYQTATDLALWNVKNGPLRFAANNAEKMRLDASGNLLVGNTSFNHVNTGALLASNGRVYSTVDGNFTFTANRLSSDGEIIRIQKDTTTVGSIRAINGRTAYDSVNDGYLSISSTNYVGWNTANMYPITDNSYDLGSPSNRFDDIYVLSVISTSDRNEKQDIAELSDAEQRVAVAAKGLLRKFRWKDAVAEKGDEARTHFGIIAQDLQAAFAAEGLDAGDYAMFISSTWTDEETGEERTRMGVRYSELLAFIIGAL